MCSHYSEEEEAAREAAGQLRIPIPVQAEIRDRYNISPTQQAWVLKPDGAASMRWGFVPAWKGAALINAKAETAGKLASFREAFRDRHCILPATAYYETPGKAAFAVRRLDDSPLLIAGLWEEHPEKGLCYTMLTCEPNARLAELHHRMPVVLPLEAARQWLTTPGDPHGLLRPCDPDLLRFYPVSRAVGNWRNDASSLLEPVTLPPV